MVEYHALLQFSTGFIQIGQLEGLQWGTEGKYQLDGAAVVTGQLELVGHAGVPYLASNWEGKWYLAITPTPPVMSMTQLDHSYAVKSVLSGHLIKW